MNIDTAINIADLRTLARKRLPRMIFDYIDGGAEDEVTLRRSVSRYDDYELTGHVLRDVSAIDTSLPDFADGMPLPFFIAPTAASRLFHPAAGERAVASAAMKAGIVYSASTLASVEVEVLHKLCPAPKWFQIYVWKDRDLVAGILDRVRRAGFETLVLTVDTPVAGKRERDPRNGFSVPPKITAQTVSQVLARPRYLFDVATGTKIGPANFPPDLTTAEGEGIAEFINRQFDASVTWEYVRWLKEAWNGPLAVKGISRTDDARRAVDAGADYVWLSNHGGRQLDTAMPTIDLLPAMAEALAGDAKLIVDGGVRRGSHIFKALARGADVVAIGRAYLYGLAAGGEAGVTRAIDILAGELRRTMALTGCASIADIRGAEVLPPLE